MQSVTSISAYIASSPKASQPALRAMRKAIQEAAPHATEAIKYGIPTFVLHGNLVHFGAFKDHLSFFPTASGVRAFKNELREYTTGKGTIQFTGKPPLALIQKIVRFRVKEQEKRTKR